MSTLLFLLLGLSLVLCPTSEAAAPAHHVYVGAFVGGDSRNPAAGGWDNEGSYDAGGFYSGPYSVDRDMVAWQGKNFAFEQTYMAPDFNSPALETITLQELELIWYYGRVPMVNLTYGSWGACQKTMVELANDLANPLSVSYQQLTTWARGLKRWLELGKAAGVNNRFLILAFLQEANHNLCAVETNPATWDFVDPAAFKSAYRRGRQVIESVVGAEPASRIQWMFAPVTVSNYWMPGFESYYPGDDVVDWLGLSAYNDGGFVIPGWTFPWQTFTDMARPFLDRLGRLSPRKPLALVQTGSVSFGGDKNAWIEQLFTGAVSYPRLYLVIYFNQLVKGEAGFPPGLDWPVFWNDSYDARPSYNVYLPTMRYQAWLNAVQGNTSLVFSPVSMPPAGSFTAANWDIAGWIAPVSNQYDLLPELRVRAGDADGDGVPNWEELASGLDPLVRDRQATETDCADGVDNDANGRTDGDDTVACGDIVLADGETRADYTLPPAPSPEKRYFQFSVFPGSTSVHVSILNPTGDVDLYVRQAGRPTTVLYDQKSGNPGTAQESVTLSAPAPGVWHVLVNGVGASTYQIQVRSSLVPKFADVPPTHWAGRQIGLLSDSGITSGCQPDNPATAGNEAMYCPDNLVTRGQMAVFITTAMGQAPAAACTGTTFNDVKASTVGSTFCAFIEKFATLGITGGCGNGYYCPNNPVTRAQMAVFIVRALNQAPAPSCAGTFGDADATAVGSTFCAFIEKFAALGITGGCGNGDYCPNNPVTRAQMAVFLTTAFLQ